MGLRDELDVLTDGLDTACGLAYERGDLIPADEVTAEAVRIHNSRIPVEDVRELWEAADSVMPLLVCMTVTEKHRLVIAVEALRERMQP